jgi:hypothetical protein
MNAKLAVTVLVTVCAGCGGYPQNPNYNRHVVAPSTDHASARTVPTQDMAVDTVLIENACNAISECRTTAHGLGV